MENSSFDNDNNFFSLLDIQTLNTNGATSDTFKARINGKWHFVKRPKKEFANHPLYITAFEKEFEIGYLLDHPNIVRYVTKGEDNDGFYFLTEYVDGLTLAEFLKENPSYFNQKEHIEKFVQQITSALSYLHSKQILHLDLKPDNILITSIGHDAKIIDLGFAYTDCYQFLTTGKSNLFASPEQLNKGVIDQRTDVYGLGMLLLYAFTENINKAFISKLPQPYRNVVTNCLAERKEDRFPNIKAVNQAVFQKKKRSFAPIFVLCLVLLLVGGGYYFSQNSDFVGTDNTEQTVQTNKNENSDQVTSSNNSSPKATTSNKNLFFSNEMAFRSYLNGKKFKSNDGYVLRYKISESNFYVNDNAFGGVKVIDYDKNSQSTSWVTFEIYTPYRSNPISYTFTAPNKIVDEEGREYWYK